MAVLRYGSNELERFGIVGMLSSIGTKAAEVNYTSVVSVK